MPITEQIDPSLIVSVIDKISTLLVTKQKDDKLFNEAKLQGEESVTL